MNGEKAMGKTHPDEGALLRLLDGEADVLEREATEAHLEGCAACVRARTALEAHRRRLMEGLGDLDALEAEVGVRGPDPLPARSDRARRADRRTLRVGRQRWLWVAAVAAVLALLFASVPPLRALAVRGWQLVTAASPAATEAPEVIAPVRPGTPAEEGPLAGRPPAAASPPALRSLGDRAAPTFILAFLPQSEHFLVDIDRWQVEGELELWIEGTGASVEAWASEELQRMDVRPGRLRIRNRAEGRTGYRVILPSELEAVIVRVEGREVVRLGPDEAGRHVLGLAAGR